jgi:hypothetical protein
VDNWKYMFICDQRIPLGMTPQKRKTQIEEAIDRLNKALALGTVKVKVGPTGAIAFTGEWGRSGISDACAYRKLLASGSPALRQALAKAEALAGRKIDPQAIASGVHLHGDTWHKGH